MFERVRDLDAAVEELKRSGFKQGDISLLATEDAVARKLGHRYERVEELEDDPKAPRTVYKTRASAGDSEGMIVGSLTYLPAVVAAGTVVASAGVVAAAVTGTAIAGALIGTVLARWLDQHQAEHPQEQLDRGGSCSGCAPRTRPRNAARSRSSGGIRRTTSTSTSCRPRAAERAQRPAVERRGSTGQDADGDQNRQTGDQQEQAVRAHQRR